MIGNMWTSWRDKTKAEKTSSLQEEELWYLDSLKFWKERLTKGNYNKESIDIIYNIMGMEVESLKAIRYVKDHLDEFRDEYCMYICIHKARKKV